MSYRSLLVHLDDAPTCAARVQQAIALAKLMQAHLVGLAPTGLLRMPLALEAAAALESFNTMAWDLLLEQAQSTAQAFRQACAEAGLKSCEAVVDTADVAESLVRHAHCSDLVILGQSDPERAGHAQRRSASEQVLMHSARPGLILPYAWTGGSLGRRALVAWDDSREAARALADALPLLRRAEQVQVLSWRESPLDEPLAARLSALQQWLMWQGVTAEVHEQTGGTQAVGELLLSRAADLDADLIVMGAYGRARWTERILGGATRGMLDAMTMPVLMSH